MKEFKGTPGRWSASDDEESMATSVIISDSLDIIAVVGTYMTSYEEDYANANLIAAAPELLDALQACLPWVNNGIARDAHVKAIAAIKKALGE